MGAAMKRVLMARVLFMLALAGTVQAQTGEGDAAGLQEAEALGVKLTAAEAARLLALALSE